MSSSSDLAGSSAGTASTATANGSRADDRRGIATDHGSIPSGSATSTKPSTEYVCGPGFTPEDSAMEVATLSPCERIEIECDLRGISPEEATPRIFAARGGPADIGNTPSRNGNKTKIRPELDASIDEAVAKAVCRRKRNVVSDGERTSSDNLLRHLDQELRSIPDGEKATYLRAIARQCPDALIAHPSGRSRFVTMLKYCGDDPRVAAKRIIEYWEERRRTFGEDRCYLPMALHGTMKDQVANMLKRPTHRMPHGQDDTGRSILAFFMPPSEVGRNDWICATKNDNMELWYMLECLCDYRSPNQSEGTVFIMNCQGVAEASFHPLAVMNQALLMLEVFPITLRAIHIVRPSDFTLREVLPVMKLDIGKKLRHRLVVHGGVHVDDEEVLGSLEEYGLPKVMMRAMVEGRQPNRKDWIHHRLALEYAESCCLGDQNAACLTGGVTDNTTITTTGSCTASSKATANGKAGASSYRGNRRQSIEASLSAVGPSWSDSAMTSERDVALALELIDESSCRSGRAGDERMSRAIKAKIQNQNLSPYDALVAGGFVFPKFQKGSKATDIFDRDNVSLHQRKNQLSRRLRHVRDAVALKGGDKEEYSG